MPTNYTHAFRLNAATHWGEAENHASYQGLAQFTVLELSRYDGAAGNGGYAFFKGAENAQGSRAWGISVITDGRVDAMRGRAGEDEVYRWFDGSTLDASNAWSWKGLRGGAGSPRSVSVVGAPHEGTAAIPATNISTVSLGSGAVVDNAAWPVRVGRPPSPGFSAWPREVAFVGIWDVELTLAQIQAAVDDFEGNRGTAALPQPVAFWKPGAGDTAQVPNGVPDTPARPALVYATGVTLVAGPDAGGGGSLTAQVMRRRRAAQGASFF